MSQYQFNDDSGVFSDLRQQEIQRSGASLSHPSTTRSHREIDDSLDVVHVKKSYKAGEVTCKVKIIPAKKARQSTTQDKPERLSSKPPKFGRSVWAYKMRQAEKNEPPPIITRRYNHLTPAEVEKLSHRYD